MSFSVKHAGAYIREKFSKPFEKIRYFFRLIISTPHWGWIFILQLISGFASLLGLPLLMPVLDMLSGNSLSAQSSKYLQIVLPAFNFLGIEINFTSTLILAAVLIIGGQLFINGASLLVSFIREGMTRYYRERLLRLYGSAQWSWLIQNNSGGMFNAVVREAEIASEAHMNAQRVFINFFQVLILLFISAYISWQITILATSVYFFVGLLNVINASFINRLSHVLNRKFKDFSTDMMSFQHNKKFIKVALLSERFGDAFCTLIDEITRIRKRQMALFEWQRAWTVMSTSILLIVLIYFHKQFALSNSTLMLILFIFMRLAPQFAASSDLYANLDMSIPMHKSIKEHLASLEEHQEKNGDKEFTLGKDIRLEGIEFGYRQDQTVLKDLSCVIPAHKVVAFVGSSGSGKTTVLDIILGLLLPKKGSIFYGDILRQDLDYHSFRQHIAFVGQRPSLLEGTIKENLMVSCENTSEEQVWDVLKKVNLDSFARTLPEGLETLVGENGMRLSGGQRQKIAIARCLLASPKILVLDEATSEMDSESEAVIQKTFQEMRSKMTTLMVAHRLASVRSADIIYVMQDGRIVESGTYDALVEKKGVFSHFVSLQRS